ncbi:helix-hairpin-helix domain-containing protein [Aquihabitans sp. G128]|uniref:helix-hairpin-helix domain-containing protein n=1 Tax=Aquihabitans sp. G128 TaxID=2849779 RepID=UPI001C2218DC|nr:helix-hairpin-helix domain-containing protein [Aquihabitans sp. G128]QXC60683.1 helix-hairpin-helix domain-containing protein [Aquihabitans sp. G128]
MSSPTAPSPTSPLTALVNVGPAVGRTFATIGLETVGDLAGRDPVEVFGALCAAAGTDLDPCLLDTVRSAVDQADGEPARPWWTYSAERKAASR